FVSNNHFMLGHLMEWLYSGLGGIKAAADAIAYDKLEIKPEQVGNITHARASYKTPYGNVVSDWSKTENNFELKIEVPVNSKATIYIPASENTKIYEGETLIKNNKEVAFKGIKKGFALLEIGSGNYVFKAVD
ncbi:alpha-L-rhamnosidase C-terminal domain-containing protein, partial [Pedobacter sp. V48]|uniref:alpha-L-rhamnosidase C-terminal domain-containing protein n=1 Tax=Pedobacter sp. V48 TaxID=509635 RepID=UPI001268D8B7